MKKEKRKRSWRGGEARRKGRRNKRVEEDEGRKER